MPEKLGGGGHAQESYDENTGQYVESGSVKNTSNDLKSKMLDFIKMKKAQSTQTTPISKYGIEEIWKNNVKIDESGLAMSKENLKYAFEKGTPEAQALLGEFFESTNTSIIRSNTKTCFNPPTGNIYMENVHLTASGVSGGYIAPGESLYHESFHAIDWKYGQLTSTFKLENGKTLREVFSDEIHDSKYSQNMGLFNEIKANFKADEQKYLHEMYTPQQIEEANQKKQYYNSIFSQLNANYSQHKITWDEYTQRWKENKKKYLKEVRDFELPARQKSQHDWIALSDICSFIYKSGTAGSPCGGHPAKYWSQMDGKLPIMEMFAELGQKWATNDVEGFNRIAKYFPKTAKGFKEILGKMEQIKNDYLNIKKKADAFEKFLQEWSHKNDN